MTTIAPGQAVKLNKVLLARPLLDLGTLSVTATQSTVTFALVHGGAAVGSSGVTINVTGANLGLETTSRLYGFFSSTSALTDSSGDIIPVSDVFGLCATGMPTSYTAFTGSSPLGAGTSLLIWQTTSPASLSVAGGRTDTLQLEIDLTSSPQLPAAVYSGTLYLVVQAM